MLAPTRSNLQLLRKRLGRVARGAALLRHKREVLVAELFKVARPALAARAQIGADAQVAWEALAVALGEHGEDGLRPLGQPGRRVQLDVEDRVVFGVAVPTIGAPPAVGRTLALRELAAATPGPAADEAATAFEHLVQELLAAAPKEILLERLAAHVQRTTQQVNVLEQRLGPGLRRDVASVARVLEEREREEHVRMRHLAKVKR